MIRGLIAFLTMGASVLTAAFTWDGSSDIYVTTKANWSGNKAPSKNDDLIFNTATNTWVEWDFANGATSQIDDLTFTPAAGNFTITSDNTGTLKIGNVDNQSSSLQIFDIPLEFQNKETVLAGGPVQFNQAVSTKTGNNQLTFTGGSQIIAGCQQYFRLGDQPHSRRHHVKYVEYDAVDFVDHDFGQLHHRLWRIQRLAEFK